jgi:hypothetical protein
VSAVPLHLFLPNRGYPMEHLLEWLTHALERETAKMAVHQEKDQTDISAYLRGYECALLDVQAEVLNG